MRQADNEMDVGIAAIGVANPGYRRSQQETAELIVNSLPLKTAERRLLKSVYKSTGIDYRYSVLSDQFITNHSNQPFPSTAKRMEIYKENAIGLVLQAIKQCLAKTDLTQSAISHVITVSCTGMYAPGIDIEIVQLLKLDPSTKRTAINFMGCYGAFNALKVAESICKSDSHAVVLIVCVELCSIHFQEKMKIDNILSNAIFADGAAAVLVQAKPKVEKSLRFNAFHCDLLPQTSKDMAWHIADSGFDIVLSTYVPEAIESGIASFLDKMLVENKLSVSEIDFYAIHPGGLKILEACEKALNIPKEQNRYSYQVLRDYGNMSSATVLFVLQSIMDDIDKRDHGKNIFSCAFGPGLTLESMLLRTHYV